MTAVQSEISTIAPGSMNAADAAAAAPSGAPAQRDGAGELLARVFELLDRDGVTYCVLHGYDGYPSRVDGDVDLLVSREAVPRRLYELLRQNERVLGARVVQWFLDRAHFIVLQALPTEGAASHEAPPVLLQLHVSTDYEVCDRVVAPGDEILRTRRRHEMGFWVPAEHLEFICALTNRIAKREVAARHAARLSALWAGGRDRCGEELFRVFTQYSTRRIADAAEAQDWRIVRDVIRDLRREMLRNLALRQPLSFAARFAGKQARRAARWVAPQSGLHVVFLGPDGVGKSTVIEAVQQRVAGAFLTVQYQTFARSLLANKPKASPHALPPRSLPESLLKAAWWLNCYTLGYFKSIHPTRARGGLAINHRYLLDAVVDPRRYRYSGPIELLRWIWLVAPKPDLVVILDAPAEIIHARKRETTLEETVRQRDAYVGLARTVARSHVIDANQAPAKTIDDVTQLILNHMSGRVARQFARA